MTDAIHPPPTEFNGAEIQTDPILQFFHYAHLPAVLQARSKPFCDLARQIIDTTPRSAERTVCLRKLLEAKDAGVRAHLTPPATLTLEQHAGLDVLLDEKRKTEQTIPTTPP